MNILNKLIHRPCANRRKNSAIFKYFYHSSVLIYTNVKYIQISSMKFIKFERHFSQHPKDFFRHKKGQTARGKTLEKKEVHPSSSSSFSNVFQPVRSAVKLISLISWPPPPPPRGKRKVYSVFPTFFFYFDTRGHTRMESADAGGKIDGQVCSIFFSFRDS